MASQTSEATQAFVPIEEIRDGIVVLKDGGMRTILLASSVNFALKSSDEQAGIIIQFQNFLNSLDFSVQMFLQSRKYDIRPYIALLEERYKAQTGDLMRIQTREYIDFVKSFSDNANIMKKSFFIIVPFNPSVLNSKGEGIMKVFRREKKTEAELSKKRDFEENRTQLEQRVGIVSQGLVRCGVKTIGLGTEEIVELFYKIFNPGDTEKPIHVE
ncbi:MAG: hypothetical protein PHS53_01580 [Candidatus Pacebacteria bacterium]|nr:hypothetical protein [Candidatus Paceibacterota bacterium]MDD5356820.1 hypothetical protein [Candidatus Paceibacterota bacterium]